MRSIEARLRKVEKSVTADDSEPVFAEVEERDGRLGIRLPDTGEWLSVEEARVSPKCSNVIAFDAEHGAVLWRSKRTLCEIIASASITQEWSRE